VQAKKLEKINASYTKALSKVVLKLWPRELITVADVLIDPSMRHGKVWIRSNPQVMIDMQSRKKDINNELTKYVSMRFVPKLEFICDDNYISHLDELFDDASVNDKKQ